MDAAKHVANALENIKQKTVKNATIKAVLCTHLKSELAEDNVCIDELISELDR